MDKKIISIELAEHELPLLQTILEEAVRHSEDMISFLEVIPKDDEGTADDIIEREHIRLSKIKVLLDKVKG